MQTAPTRLFRLAVAATVVVLLLATGATVLGAADLRKANLEIRQVLAAGTAYRDLERALALESPAQWTLRASGNHRSTATSPSIDALFSAAAHRYLQPATLDRDSRAEIRMLVAMQIRYSAAAQRYVTLRAGGDVAGSDVWQQRELQPRYVALSNRLRADVDQEPLLVRWHLGRVAQVSEVMWVGSGAVLATLLLLLSGMVLAAARQRKSSAGLAENRRPIVSTTTQPRPPRPRTAP